jgi:hypothetical protein
MERCPICRATLNGAETCRRCRAELGSAIRAEEAARHLEDRAMHRLALGDFDGAADLLRQSLHLHRTSVGRALYRLVTTRTGSVVPSAEDAVPM